MIGTPVQTCRGVGAEHVCAAWHGCGTGSWHKLGTNSAVHVGASGNITMCSGESTDVSGSGGSSGGNQGTEEQHSLTLDSATHPRAQQVT